jgi:hypothetical protein
MLWFKRKKDNDKPVVYNTNRYLRDFDIHINKDNEKKHYSDMYDHVRQTYESEILKNKNFIHHERVRLQAKTGKYNVMPKTININLVILAIGFFINTITLALSQTSLESFYKSLSIYAVAFIGYGMLLFGVYKNINESDTSVFDLALQVLDDLEKEVESGYKDLVLNSEVAATVQPQEQSGHLSNQSNGNWNIEINTLSLIDIIEGIYKSGKLIKKIFRKK